MTNSLNHYWWTIRLKNTDNGGKSGVVVREFSLDKHSEPLPPAVEFQSGKGIQPRKGGYYAVGRGVEAKDGEYPLGPFKTVDEAKAAALGASL